MFKLQLLSAAVLVGFAACQPDATTTPLVESPSFAVIGSGPGGTPLSATLSGAQEAPVPGDPDGAGTFRLTLNQGQGTICYELTVTDIEPATAAHIHKAPVGFPGPAVVPLEAPADGSSSDCVSAAKALIKAIRKDPAQYYVNVHNEEFKPGAVRGQLSR